MVEHDNHSVAGMIADVVHGYIDSFLGGQSRPYGVVTELRMHKDVHDNRLRYELVIKNPHGEITWRRQTYDYMELMTGAVMAEMSLIMASCSSRPTPVE